MDSKQSNAQKPFCYFEKQNFNWNLLFVAFLSTLKVRPILVNKHKRKKNGFMSILSFDYNKKYMFEFHFVSWVVTISNFFKS